MLRVLSYRTATVWKTLCPFWGEEYQVHLPPTFHAVAFYVMDEDALRWVCPALQLGLQSATVGAAGPFASFLRLARERERSPEGLGGGRTEGVSVDACASHVCMSTGAWRYKLRNGYPCRAPVAHACNWEAEIGRISIQG